MIQSEFAEWYRAQYGPQLSPTTIQALKEEAAATQRRANVATTLLRLAEEWEARRNACLMAWCAAKDGTGKAP